MTRDDVRLVPLSSAHAERTFQWVLDPSVRDQIGLRSEPSYERTIAWIATASVDEGTRAFAILANGEHVGNVVLDLIDDYLSTARFSIYIGPSESRGAGVGLAATKLAARYGFDELGLIKIWLTVHAENEVAQKTYAQAGFKVEGTLRGEFILGDRRLDAVRMGLFPEELEP